jgi:hypothetical protein
MDRRKLADRALRGALWVVKRFDPTVTGLHAVRCSKLSWAAGLDVVEDACMPPGKGLVGNLIGYPIHGVHSIDFPRSPRSKVTITAVDASDAPGNVTPHG